MSTDTILTKKRFTKIVEETVESKRMSYIDAIVFVCEERGLDTGEINNLISPIIKEKLEAEAINLKMVKGGNSLPI